MTFHHLSTSCALSLVVLLSLWAGACDGQSTNKHQRWTLQDFPNPRLEHTRCGRFRQSWVCDPNALISEQDANQIDDLIQSIYNQPRCSCYTCINENRGYVVMVALMPRMHRIINASNSLPDVLIDAKVYSYWLSEKWKISTCNESITILYSQDDDVVYTLTRKLVAAKISDQQVVDITMDAKDHFVPGNKAEIARGLKQMITNYKAALMGDYVRRTPIPPAAVRQEKPKGSAGRLSSSLALFLPLAFLLASIL